MELSINFQARASLYALHNTKRLINKFTNKYILFHNIFNVKGFETKDYYLRACVRERVKNHCSSF